MSGKIQPIDSRDREIEVHQDGALPADWGGGQEAPPAAKGLSIGRYLSAINRFKWLVVLLGILGGAAGYFATKFIVPEYAVQATIKLEQSSGSRGPIQAEELLAASGWQDLLRSYAIADPVVTDLGLFITPASLGDSLLFKEFRVDRQQLRAGTYTLTVSGDGYSLSLLGSEERGVLGDSIGRVVGFRWQPPAELLRGRKEVKFNVQTPREASTALMGKMRMNLASGSPFLFVHLTGPDAERTAATLNAWVEQFVVVATALKKQKVSQIALILEGQTQYAADNLSASEAALQGFRVRTVTEPTERQSMTPGIELTTNPVFDAYFRDRVLVDSYRKDRESLERLLAQGKQGGTLTREAILSIPIVNSDPAAENLRALLAEQAAREVTLRRLQEKFTDNVDVVKNEIAALASLKMSSIPNALDSFLSQLRLREEALHLAVAQRSTDLRGIPVRTIEEQRLKREVANNEELYRSLNLKSAEAKLADAATIPDVRVLDSAVAPLSPTRNTAPMIILGAIGAALAAGLALAILLDLLDKRFRYPEQASGELGLFVLGVVPAIHAKKGAGAVDQAAQVVEAFRTIRMNARYAADPQRPFTMTITSPGPNDGKSLIASNLALSFAEGGARTLLIDGDIRRGELAITFGTRARPGLVEYLDGTALIAEVLYPANSHPNLTLMPTGARRKRAPELLATPRLTQVIEQLTKEYDVVIVDSPPLGAGFDAYALSAATGNMALVMRVGVTDRKMAAAKMAIVDTLPVRVMGCILNGIKLTGVYEYYGYYQDYASKDEEPVRRLSEGAQVESLEPAKRG